MSGSNAQKTSFPIFNGYAPKEGPKGLPVAFDFTVNAVQEVDLLLENTNGVIQYVQSIYVDNSTNINPLVILVPSTMQRIVIPATAQGVWPIFAIDQVRLVLASVVDPSATGNIILLNVPMPLTQWGPTNVNVTADVSAIAKISTFNNWSGTIGTGGSSQICIPSNVARMGFVIQNPSTEIEPLYIEFAGGAVIGQSIEILPGQMFPANGQPYVWTPTIEIMAATTGHVYIAKEFLQ